MKFSTFSTKFSVFSWCSKFEFVRSKNSEFRDRRTVNVYRIFTALLENKIKRTSRIESTETPFSKVSWCNAKAFILRAPFFARVHRTVPRDESRCQRVPSTVSLRFFPVRIAARLSTRPAESSAEIRFPFQLGSPLPFVRVAASTRPGQTRV